MEMDKDGINPSKNPKLTELPGFAIQLFINNTTTTFRTDKISVY